MMATKIYRLRGDWMRDGYIDNFPGESRQITVAVIDGRAYAVDRDGFPATWDSPLELDLDDCIRHIGATGPGFFQPDESEIDRIGRDVFRSA